MLSYSPYYLFCIHAWVQFNFAPQIYSKFSIFECAKDIPYKRKLNSSVKLLHVYTKHVMLFIYHLHQSEYMPQCKPWYWKLWRFVVLYFVLLKNHIDCLLCFAVKVKWKINKNKCFFSFVRCKCSCLLLWHCYWS